MKARNIYTMLLATGVLATVFTGCNNENEELGTGGSIAGKHLTITATQEKPVTRLSYSDDQDGFYVAWNENDAFMLFKDGKGEKFTLTDSGGTNEGTFEGTDPSGSGDYHAIYPAAKAGNTWNETVLDIRGQVQVGQDSKDHLSNYDFLTGTLTNQVVSFDRLISVLKFYIELPDNVYPKTLILETNSDEGFCVSKKADGTPVSYSNQLAMQIAKNQTGADADFSEFFAYIAVFENTVPVGKELGIKIIAVDGTIYRYTGTVSGAEFKYTPGYIYYTTLGISGGKELTTDGCDTFNSTVAKETITNLGTTWAHGSGVAGDPYLIESANDLRRMVLMVNDATDPDTRKAHFRLMTDIKIKATWTGIGTGTAYFKGVFDGNGHIISGNYITEAFFTRVEGVDADNPAVIKNLTITNDYRVQATSGVTGIVIGMSKNHLACSNCIVTGSIKLENDAAPIKNLQAVVGTILGQVSVPQGTDANTSIKNCVSNSNINLSINHTNNFGGYIGGICGKSSKGILIENCVSYGNINLSIANTYTTLMVGGIIGEGSSNVSCTNYGNITVTGSAGDSYAGGILGNSLGSDSSDNISNCTNTGNISIACSGSLYLGGVIGSTDSSNKIVNCKNKGSMAGTTTVSGASSGYYIGGLAGQLLGTLHNSHNLSPEISATGTSATNKALGSLVGLTSKKANVFSCCTTIPVNNTPPFMGQATDNGNQSYNVLQPCSTH